MITANNFGAAAADINVNAIQSNDFLLLHGTIAVNTRAAAYLAAEALELTLEGVMIPNSAPAAVYITANSSGNKVITVAKAELINQTTLRIEKVAAWSKFFSYTIQFQNIFITRGREISPQNTYGTNLYLSNPPSGIQLYYGWVMQYAGFMSLSCIFKQLSTENPGTPIELTVSALDNKPVVKMLLIYNQDSIEGDGSGYVEATVGNGKICFPDGLPALANLATGYKYIKGFCIPEE